MNINILTLIVNIKSLMNIKDTMSTMGKNNIKTSTRHTKHTIQTNRHTMQHKAQ